MRVAMSGFVSRRAGMLLIGSVILLGAGLLARNVIAASNAYLLIDGIKGESMDDKHKDWLQVDSVSWGESRTSSMASAASGAGAGKVSLHEFTITKRPDAASPKLAQFASTGKHIPKMVLDLGGRLYSFQDATITSVRKEGQKEVVAIKYARVMTSPTATIHPLQNMNSMQKILQPQ
jgi:type VI secretion system Hcp family effector